MHWPSHFLSSVYKFPVIRAVVHTRQYILRGLLFYKQDHIIVCSQLSDSCFTISSEACQNMAILPVISYYAKNEPIDMKKALCGLFFADVPHTQPSTGLGRGAEESVYFDLVKMVFFIKESMSPTTSAVTIKDVVGIIHLCYGSE